MWACVVALMLAGESFSQQARVSVGVRFDGQLVYTADDRGNRVIDFSHAGYGGGGVAIPDAVARIVVSPGDGDDGARIQRALDLVAAMPLDARGLRGAVLLRPGHYEVAGSLRIRASGVVLRGSGKDGVAATTIVATGSSRRTLVQVAGRGTPIERPATRRSIAQAYVPVGSQQLILDDTTGITVGDRLVVHRPSSEAWISQLGMDTFPGWRPENRLHWQAGSRDIKWDRTVVGVEGTRVDLDAPLTTAIDAVIGGGSVYAYAFTGRITHAGIEHLRLESAFDASRRFDEDHAWNAIELDAIDHGWVRQVSAAHFAGSAVQVGAHALHVTVEDVDARDPVSEVGGFRRRVFVNMGQLSLFQRCSSVGGKHDFVMGFTAAGPNVFRDSIARGALDFSGPLESWSSGTLYDNVIVRGHALRLANRDVGDQGAGWAAANSVLWNCEATDVEVQHPPGAHNLAYGCKGTLAGDGIVVDARAVPFRDFFRGMAVEPRSLYDAQLRARRGEGAVLVLATRPIGIRADDARALGGEDLLTLDAGAVAGQEAQSLEVRNGTFVVGDQPAWTEVKGFSWFQAQIPPSLAAGIGPAITRFAPGRYGPGLTDDLEDVVTGLEPGGVFVQHYGLWYDRRRVNHDYDGSAERRTGDAWAPFMELPWARSGEGQAWDGLSTYDLTRFNPWYFERVASFADLARRHGRVLYHHFYFQHWLLESRAHYVDFPWRPVNSIQATGMPDQVPAANAFYDVTHPVRRDLHRRYIRHTLDVLGASQNVVFGLDREYTGPLAFVQFWLDTIADWQREHQRTVFVALEIPKAQVDAILDDPVRGALVTAVGFHHWVYRPDGVLFSVRGGIDRAPREQAGDIVSAQDRLALGISDPAFAGDAIVNAPAFQQRQRALWATTPAMRYRAWREYRDRSASLVVLGQSDPNPTLSRAVDAAIPATVCQRLRPVDVVQRDLHTVWASGVAGGVYVVYSMEGRPIVIDLAGDAATYEVIWVDGVTGGTHAARPAARTREVLTLTPPSTGQPWVAWIRRSR